MTPPPSRRGRRARSASSRPKPTRISPVPYCNTPARAIVRSSMAPARPPTPVKTRVPKHGRGLLRVGGPNGGAGGRPRDEWKAALAALVSREDVLAKLASVIGDTAHKDWLGAWKTAASYAYGQPEATTTVKGDAIEPLVIRVVHE